MKPVARSVLAAALPLIGGACGAAVQSAPAPEAPVTRIGPAALRERYQAIWSSVGGEVPPVVVHLGAAAGNRIAAWARSDAGRGAAARSWSIACAGTDAVDVREEVHDARFGVSKLAITRSDGGAAPLPCTLRVGGSSAQVVVPVLPQSPAPGRFSFLAYSCSEPFSTGHGGGIYARDLSLWLRMGARAGGEDSRGQLPERPAFVLGLGDQVYVDPDPNTPRPLAFFRGRDSNRWLVHTDADSLYGALDAVYRYNFSLPPVAQAFSKLPSFMMWDDHEIRDGWGSQDDERSDTMSTYFRVARHAFIANQLLRSYAPGTLSQAGYDALVAGGQTLHTPVSHGERTHVLMLDSRSTRGRAPSIFEEPERSAVRDWLARGRPENGDLYVLTVGVPLFPNRILKKASITELDDDLRDSWDSPDNREARERLLDVLGDHFASNPRDRLLVLSGDVHYSALFFLVVDGRVVGQEVVTSGIAHSLPGAAIAANYHLDVAKRAGPFQVRPAGKISQSASFAELVVNPGPSGSTPGVDVVFHTNGAKFRNGPWAVANTGLLRPQDRPLWYYPYRYDYGDVSAHLDSVPAGVTPAGTLVPLPMRMPKLKTRTTFFQWLLGRNAVQSAIEPQSVTCWVRGTDYNATPARSWDLAELASRCEPLER
ncbi:MAG TPA: alkaline phosphatase D family protein [Longimicrobiaceae bacterium]